MHTYGRGHVDVTQTHRQLAVVQVFFSTQVGHFLQSATPALSPFTLIEETIRSHPIYIPPANGHVHDISHVDRYKAKRQTAGRPDTHSPLTHCAKLHGHRGKVYIRVTLLLFSLSLYSFRPVTLCIRVNYWHKRHGPPINTPHQNRNGFVNPTLSTNQSTELTVKPPCLTPLW